MKQANSAKIDDLANDVWYVIDEHGTVWKSDSPELRRTLYCFHYHTSLLLDLIRNVGFVGVKRFHNTLRIMFNKNTVSTAALGRAIYVMADRKIKCTIICDTTEKKAGHRDEVIQGLTSAVNRLAEISKDISVSRQIKTRHMSVDKVRANHNLAPILQAWIDENGICATHTLEQLGSSFASGRYFTVRPEDGQQFVIRSMGNGVQIPNGAKRHLRPGVCIEHQVDEVYLKWIKACYNTTLLSARPDFSLVTARFFWRDHGWVRKEYARLLLPCTDFDGNHYLFSANTGKCNSNFEISNAA